MGLKENDIKDLGDGLEFGNETVPEAVGKCDNTQSCGRVQSGCTTWCEKNCQYCETWCERSCQKQNEICPGCQGGCMGSCEYVCETSCEKNCQTSCEKGCQSACEKSSQCGSCESGCQSRCEKNYQCTYCENCESSCEKSSQCGSCQSGCQTSCESGCQTSCEKGCQTGAQTNTAPTTPSTIAVPPEIKGGDTIIIQWGTSTDSNLSGYILQKKTDSGSFTQIYKGSSRSFSDTVAVGTGTVQYRVKAYDSYGAESGYRTSNLITVVNNSTPVISGKDTDLGGKKAPFIIDVSVSDRDNDPVDLIAKLNGSVIKTITNAKKDSNYTVRIEGDTFNRLALNARNEIEISATDGKATSYRRYYFTRVNSAPEIKVATTDFGTKNLPFSFKYTVSDAEGDPTNIRILYGEKVLQAIKSVPLGKEQTFTFKKLDFSQIPAGDIVIKIEATDDKGGTSAKIISFKKEINGCGYIFKKDTKANATQVLISVSRKIDEKSTFKTMACNNANDSNPAWEDVTDSLEKIYNFKNASKTANTWAIGVKVEVVRGKDAGDSYIDAIGINFR